MQQADRLLNAGQALGQVLAVQVRRSFKATDVLDVLAERIAIRGVLRHIRSDNGPELISVSA